MRINKPEKGNKYYIRIENGGWSPAIKGRPVDHDCNVLSNCVGYAIGRFNEILQSEGCLYLKSATAKYLIRENPDLEVGMEPKVGSVMVWKAASTGHCAIVEKVVNQNEVITSESFYGGRAFANVRRKREDDWGARPGRSFIGFIYPPKNVELIDKTKEAIIFEASELNNEGGNEFNEFGFKLPKHYRRIDKKNWF